LASRSAERRSIAGAAAVAVCAGFLALADGAAAQLPPLPGQPQPPPPSSPGSAPATPSSKVRVGSTSASAEIPETLPIRRHPGQGKKVVISLRPGDLPGLQTGDQLEVTAEVEVTTDCLQRYRGGADCRGKAYRFNPRVSAALMLTDRQKSTTGLPLSETQQMTCRQKLPARQHHCYMALAPPPFLVSDQDTLPCAPGSCHVNLVMDASHRLARPGTRLLIGGNNRGGDVEQGKGSIDAVRIRPPDSGQVPPPPPLGTTTHSTSERLATSLSLGDPPRKAVVYSQRLEGLEEGEQLAVRAGMITGVRRLRHNAKINSRIVLADNPGDRDPGAISADVASEEGEITEGNGFNCTQRTTPCTTIKAGVLEIEEDASSPLYVNLTLSISRVGGKAPGDKLVRVQESGGLQVIRYPAEQKG
jgi:hypothetical protein